MATRRDIREAFYDGIETAVVDDGLVPAEHVTQEYPERKEHLPAVVHRDSYRRVPTGDFNAPTHENRNADDEVDEQIYTTLMEARFVLTMVDDDEQAREDIYEAVRWYFERYTHDAWDVTDIHADATTLFVDGAASQTMEGRVPIARGDSLTIRLRYKRFYQKGVDPIRSIDSDWDVEIDVFEDDPHDLDYETTTT